MNEMQIFNSAEFGEVRTIEVNGKPYFMASDIARALGYIKPNNAIKQHCRATLKQGIPISGKIQDVIFIPEGDLYRMITHSKLPSAEKFETWVFDDVLPSIRKNGYYSPKPQLPTSKLEILKLTYEAMDELKSEIGNVRDELEDFKMDLPLLPIETERLTEITKRKGVNVLGGKNSSAYRDRSMRTKVYKSIYSHLTYQFGVRSYKAIKRSQCEKAISIIERYEPPVFLSDQIEAFNAQETLF